MHAYQISSTMIMITLSNIKIEFSQRFHRNKTNENSSIQIKESINNLSQQAVKLSIH